TDTCVIQFGGSGLDQWDVDELSVLTNMTVEGGLMTGIVEPCASVRRFIEERRGDLAPDLLARFVEPDPQARYARTIRVDLGEVPLTVATPGDSRNRQPLSEVAGQAVHNVVIASCTGGSLADLRAAADVLRGRLHPTGCPEFGRGCTPERPLGAPMVSSEGACAAYFHHRRLQATP
ncbi:MAG: hypothetical protein KDK70_42870, partial [Myxococcales bacterium]|nr:hypothetical protein [Myxococcales bacterium]